jgi:hypothetical protein
MILESQNAMSAANGATTDPTTGMQDARVQERRISAKISLSARPDLKHIQRPKPPHLSKNAPGLSGLGDADMAQSRRRGVSPTCQQNCYVLYSAM